MFFADEHFFCSATDWFPMGRIGLRKLSISFRAIVSASLLVPAFVLDILDFLKIFVECKLLKCQRIHVGCNLLLICCIYLRENCRIPGFMRSASETLSGVFD
jgi:hypothetical protein